MLYLVHVYQEVDEEKDRNVFLCQLDHMPPFSASFTTAIGAIAMRSARDSVFYFLAMVVSDRSMAASEFANCNWFVSFSNQAELFTTY
jgi:hypothetical protein